MRGGEGGIFASSLGRAQTKLTLLWIAKIRLAVALRP